MKSVHLETFPNNFYNPDQKLIIQMNTIRAICSGVLSIRKKFNLRARLPLNKLTIIGENALDLQDFIKFITEETNVKKIILDPNFTKEAEQKVEIIFEKAGKKFGKKMPQIANAIKQKQWKKLSNGSLLAGDEILTAEDFNIKLVPTIEGENYESIGSELLIILDVEVNEMLELEGMARDFIRIIQNERKLSNFEVNDKIILEYNGDETFKNILKHYQSLIASQCLISEMHERGKSNNFKNADLEITSPLIYIKKV